MRKTTIILSRIKTSIEIYHLIILKNQDYLFKLEELSYVTIYAYMINIITRIIMIRNDFNNLVQILRNRRLEKVIKLNFFNAFYVKNVELRDLVTRKSKFQY